MRLVEETLIRQKEEVQCLHIRAIATKRGREIIIFHKETGVVMGAAIFLVLPMGDLMDKEQVLVMDRVTMGKERIKDFHKRIRETYKVGIGTRHPLDLTRTDQVKYQDNWFSGMTSWEGGT